eukprot:34969-Eustigmatos_ZCMA.PRE.1
MGRNGLHSIEAAMGYRAASATYRSDQHAHSSARTWAIMTRVPQMPCTAAIESHKGCTATHDESEVRVGRGDRCTRALVRYGRNTKKAARPASGHRRRKKSAGTSLH